MKVIVTTGQKVTESLIERAKMIADKLNIQFVFRNNDSVELLKRRSKADIIIVVTKQRIVAYTDEGELFFHLNMAQLRIQNIDRGQVDHMIMAMHLKKGMSVLDCTLGMGTDAIVASYIVGVEGKVVGVENSGVTSFIVKNGLEEFCVENVRLEKALKQIEVVQADYNQYLLSLPDKTFDVVYFDPMFRHPLKESVALKPLRAVADHRPIELQALKEARRVARKYVVVKENRRSKEFERLFIENIVGGKYSNINYGVIQVGDENRKSNYNYWTNCCWKNKS